MKSSVVLDMGDTCDYSFLLSLLPCYLCWSFLVVFVGYFPGFESLLCCRGLGFGDGGLRGEVFLGRRFGCFIFLFVS